MNNKNTCAIVDYGMGNLFSVKNACDYVGLNSIITSSFSRIESSKAIILPGVGAFKNAMEALEKLNLINLIIKSANEGKPVIGICLGMQLLFKRSYEFGRYEGLGLIDGDVNLFKFNNFVKVPHIGWNNIIEKKIGRKVA